MYNNFCNKKQGSHLSVLSRFLPSGKEAAVVSRPIPYSPGSYGGFFLITFNCSLPQIHSGNSLISLPPAHTWPDNHPEAPADCHRWACNCSVAWSCSEWLGENSLPNEAAQGVASPLLRPVCVGLSRQLCDLAYISMLLSHTHNNCYLLCQRQKKRPFLKVWWGWDQ